MMDIKNENKTKELDIPLDIKKQINICRELKFWGLDDENMERYEEEIGSIESNYPFISWELRLKIEAELDRECDMGECIDEPDLNGI